MKLAPKSLAVAVLVLLTAAAISCSSTTPTPTPELEPENTVVPTPAPDLAATVAEAGFTEYGAIASNSASTASPAYPIRSGNLWMMAQLFLVLPTQRRH